MEEHNKNLISTLNSFEFEDITALSDILKDINEFNEFDNVTLSELLNIVNSVIKENENSKLSKIKEELNKKYLNQYIKYCEDGETTILKKVINIIVEPAFEGNDFVIKFITNQAIFENESSVELKLLLDNNEAYQPLVFYSELESVEIISEKDYCDLLARYSIVLKDKE
jgi:hypothetical protein